MLFDVDRDTLLEVFPEAQVIRASRDALDGIEVRAEDLDFLCEVGIPQGLFQICPPIAADGGLQRSRMLDLGDEDDAVPFVDLDGVGPVVLLGGIQYWYVFLCVADGVIHSFAEDGDEYYPINGDLSALCRMLHLLEREHPRTHRTPGVPYTGPSHEEYRRAAELIRAEIEPRDPTAYADGSLWPHYFDSFTDGLYPKYT
ncbi:SUKH-4 family immunity protein [Embleya sp. NBC_00896]|uniref:SUKH-4 family immunity protein n=1 Tax=Embleya sp. NBC_00896 TaxID=2975961 RepID=UPI00386F04F7|nr:SUKH-4 family immunity protein [Embleya sp. NBC_00896]